MTDPRVMIGVATKYDEKYLDDFLKTLANLDYPKENLNLAIVVGDPTQAFVNKVRSYKIASLCSIYEEQKRWRPKGVSFKADLYADLASLVTSEDFVLFIDSDIVSVPNNLLHHLISRNVDIVAPYVYTNNSKIFFDTYIFRLNGKGFPQHPTYPPQLLEMESVGSCLLVKSKVLKECGFANPHHWLHFCYFARQKGFKVYADPTIRIEHADVRGEPPHMSFESLAKSGFIDIPECIRRGVFTLEDIERFEKIIGVTLKKNED